MLMRVEGLRLPFAAVDLGHADGGAELRRKLGQRGIAFAEQQIAGLLGGILVDANTATAHLQNHRQQVDVQAISVAGLFLIQDGVELLKQQERVDRIGLGVRADIPRRQLPDVALDVDLLAPWREAGGLDCFAQQRSRPCRADRSARRAR